MYLVVEVPPSAGQRSDADVNWVTDQLKNAKFTKLTAPGPKGYTFWYTQAANKGYHWVVSKKDSSKVDVDSVPELAVDENGVYGFNGNPNGGAHFQLKQ